jgi:hypothetical protein
VARLVKGRNRQDGPVKSGQILSHGEELTSLAVHQRRGMVAENMMISRWKSEGAPQGWRRSPTRTSRNGYCSISRVARDGDAVLKIEDLGISLLIAESNLRHSKTQRS